MAGVDSPNGDGLLWFLEHVLPLIRSRIPWVRLRVTGRYPPAALLAMSNPNLCFDGHVSDLAAFYNEIRVIVSPIRFGSGVKLKTIQAIQYAVPTVATTIAAEGMTLDACRGVHVSDDPTVFAAAVTRLMTDAHEWEESRTALVACVETWRSARRPASSWSGLVSELCARRVDGNVTAAAAQ
jgi:hypothetical protein